MGRGLKILCIIIKAWVATVFWVARMHLAHPDLGAHAHGVLEHPQNCGKIVGKNVNLQKVRVWVQSATTLNWTCAHVCVRT